MNTMPSYNEGWRQIQNYVQNQYPRLTGQKSLPIQQDLLAQIRSGATDPQSAMADWRAASSQYQIPFDTSSAFTTALSKEKPVARSSDYYDAYNPVISSSYTDVLGRQATEEEIKGAKQYLGALGVSGGADVAAALGAKILSSQEGQAKVKSPALKDKELTYGPAYRSSGGAYAPLFKTSAQEVALDTEKPNRSLDPDQFQKLLNTSKAV